MIKGMFKDTSPLFKIIFTGLLMVVSFIVVFFSGVFAVLPFLDFGLMDFMSLYDHLDSKFHVNLLKYIQALNTIGLFVVPPMIAACFFGEKVTDYLSVRANRKAMIYLLVILAMVTSLPLINMLAEINSKLHLPEMLDGLERIMKNAEENARYITEIFVNVDSFKGFLINLVVIAVIPALGEELLFRGLFQKLFISWTRNVHAGIFISAILFSAFHFQFYGFIPRMLMGVYFGYMLVWTKSIWIPVLAHFINNAAAVTFYYLVNINVVSFDLENLGAEGEVEGTLVISLLIFILLTLGIFKLSESKKAISQH